MMRDRVHYFTQIQYRFPGRISQRSLLNIRKYSFCSGKSMANSPFYKKKKNLFKKTDKMYLNYIVRG